MLEAAPISDFIVTATANKNVVGAAHLAVMKDHCVLANSGHFNVEINVAAEHLAAAEGHPSAVMDMSFAIQALRNHGRLTRAVHDVPKHTDAAVARSKLAAPGVCIDELTSEARQVRFSIAPDRRPRAKLQGLVRIPSIT